MKKSLRAETLFYGISKYSTVVITLLTTAVLSRILTPAEYGTVSVITVFTSFFSILSDLGLGTAIIQNKELTQNEIDDIYSFSVYMSIGLGAIFALLGWPVSVFYEEYIYIRVCILLSISVLFNAMNIIPNALLMRAKHFTTVGIRQIVTAVVTGAIAVVMASLGCGFYALIFQSIFQALLIFAWNRWNVFLRFRIHFQITSIQKVAQFSLFQFLYNFINYFARNIDNLLIGKVMGSESLAYYDKGYKLMMYPVQNLTYVVNPIVHPILSDYQNDKQYIYNAYLKIVRVLSMVGVLITFVCFWNSREIILIFFGNQWNESVPIFRLLSLSVWPQMVSSSAGSIYQSSGNTKLMFKSGVIHFSLTIILIIVGLISGQLPRIALLVTVSLYCRFFIDYYFLIAVNFRFSYIKFLKTFKNELFIAVGMLAVIVLGRNIIIANLFISLAVKVGILGSVYLFLSYLTGQLKLLIQLVKGKRGLQRK